MIPRAASIRACARDCAMSCGHSRRSKPIEVFRRWKSGCWGSWKRDTGGAVYAGRRLSDRAPQRSAGARASTWPSLISREERQRERARGDVLADRELALAVAEALAVEAHQVDRRQVGLALDARARRARARSSSRSTPRGSCTTNTNQPRTSPPRSAHGSSSPSIAGERLAVELGHARARGEHLVEAPELREPERAGDVREAVVEAEPVVVEPAHVRRAALVALGVDPLLQRRVAERDHPALARRQLLVGVEAEHRRVAARADRRAVGVTRAERLAGVLDDRQAARARRALERRHVGRVAEDVHRQQRARALA